MKDFFSKLGSDVVWSKLSVLFCYYAQYELQMRKVTVLVSQYGLYTF